VISAANQASAKELSRKPNKLGGLCTSGWNQRAHCKRVGVSLYKHLISMPIQICVSVDDSQAVELPQSNQFAAYTEAAAVAAHLLSIQSSEGCSRFVLLPQHPEGDSGMHEAPARAEAR